VFGGCLLYFFKLLSVGGEREMLLQCVAVGGAPIIIVFARVAKDERV